MNALGEILPCGLHFDSECLLMHWWVKIQVFRNKIPNFLCFSFIFSSFTTIKKKFYGKWEAAGARVTVWITAGRIPGTPTHQSLLEDFSVHKKKKKKKSRQNCFSGLLPEDWHCAWVHCDGCYIPFSSTPWEFREQKKTKSNGHNPEPCNTDGLCRLNEVHLLINTIKPHCY